jgi:hypothetical protein
LYVPADESPLRADDLGGFHLPRQILCRYGPSSSDRLQNRRRVFSRLWFGSHKFRYLSAMSAVEAFCAISTPRIVVSSRSVTAWWRIVRHGDMLKNAASNFFPQQPDLGTISAWKCRKFSSRLPWLKRLTILADDLVDADLTLKVGQQLDMEIERCDISSEPCNAVSRRTSAPSGVVIFRGLSVPQRDTLGI